tara:strand:+ start:2992 stop:3285 length:294 start_codon:yes stop_codon:yes gene_type:complete
MPKRSKRKLVQNHSNVDFPYPKYRVEWVDCVSDSGWANQQEFDKMKLSYPVNEGWIFSKDRESIKMFASYDKDENGITFGDRTMIPRSWIKKMTKLS